MGCEISSKKTDSRILESYTLVDVEYTQGQFNKQKKTEDINDILVNPKNLISSVKNAHEIKKNYKIMEKIGTGSFGRVFKVFHYPSEQLRAMKVVKKEATKQQDDDKKFLKEIEVLALLDHPNILKILEYFYDDSNYYVVTELITGGELFDHVQKQHNFSENRVCLIMEQLFSVVRYLHSKGIVHRDLKLENILVESMSNTDDEIIIKLIDFGASNFFAKNMKLSLKIGTPYYIAPEVLDKSYSYKLIFGVAV